MRKFIFLLMALVALNFCVCSAEVKTFHAESSYLMDKSMPIKIAQEKIFNDAIQKISEEVNIVIDSLNVSRDSEPEFSRVESFTAAVVHVKSKTFGKEIMSDGGLKITVEVDAEIDTDDAVEILNELREAKNSSKNYDEVLKDYTQRKKNFDTIYGEYLGSYQKRILRKIREGCKLQSDGKVDAALKFYDEAIKESVANNAELSLAYIKRGTIYIAQKNFEAFAENFKRAIELNNDAVGLHWLKAIIHEGRGDNVQAAQEYRAFVKDADIVYYDVEISVALDRIVELEGAN